MQSNQRQYHVFPWQYRDIFQSGYTALHELTAAIESVIQHREVNGIPSNAVDVLGKLSTASTQQDSKVMSKEIMSNLHLLLLAGSDTTSALLTATILMLCVHTDVQAKLHAELDSYEAAATRDFNADDMNQLVYMQAC
jgi:cytochrome P450